MSPPLFPAGELTDRERAISASPRSIREKLTLELNQELPYGIAVEIERSTSEDGQLVIDAVDLGRRAAEADRDRRRAASG